MCVRGHEDGVNMNDDGVNMNDEKQRAMVLGDLARLKATWSKVEESIAEESEVKERAAAEAQRKREEEAKRRDNRRETVRKATERLIVEVGGFTRLLDHASTTRLLHISTNDTLSINEGPGGTFLIFIDADSNNLARSCGNTSDLQEPLTEEAVMARILEIFIQRHRDYLPKDRAQEGRIL